LGKIRLHPWGPGLALGLAALKLRAGARYSDTGDTNIGLNPLTCDHPLWYAGPDLPASKLKTNRAPKIIQAFRLIPQGLQPGMKAITIGTRIIDPNNATHDFFRAEIEERKTLPKSHPHYLLLKIIANALYGIFAELNKYEYSKNRAKLLEVFSGEHRFEQPALVVERPGRWQFPLAAALITAGGRLMLAILEHMAEQRGGTYLLTDTDSMLFVASRKGGLARPFPKDQGPRKCAGNAGVVVRKPTRSDAHTCHDPQRYEGAAQTRPWCSKALQFRALANTR
jgi:hypothetical protein